MVAQVGAPAAARHSRRHASARRCWNVRCVPARTRSTISSARSAQPPSSRRRQSLPRPAAGRHDDDGGKDRQPVDPRRRRFARTADDHGVRAGADPQPASGDRAPPRGFRIQGAAAAALQRHRRAAGRRDEDAHAADRQRLAEVAAHRARSLRRTRQADRARHAGRRNRTRSPGARSDQGSAHPHGAQFRRPRLGAAGRSAAPPASRSAAASACRPITRAATSSSRSPTTGAGSTPNAIKAKAIAQGLASEAEIGKLSEAQIHKFIFVPGFSTADRDHQRLRPRRRHGRGAQQYRPDRRHHRREVGAPARA